MIKNGKLKRISAAFFVALTVFALALIPSGSGGDPAAAAVNANPSAKSSVLSTEDYYRLLYLNGVARSKNVVYDFEKSGYDPSEIEVSMNGIKLLGNLNIACIALGFVPKIGKPVKLIQSALRFISVYQINANNLEMMRQMTDNLSELYNSLSEDIERQTSILSGKMTEVANYVSDTIKKAEYAAIIREFSATGFGSDEGYYNWKKNLLSRYNALIFYLDEANNATPEEIKIAYDYLYICAKKSDKLLSYIVDGEYAGDISIQEVLYRYYLIRSQSDPSLSMKDSVSDCISFLQDIYNTYLFARICLTQCYSYQTEEVGSSLPEGASLATKQYELHRTINTDNRAVSFFNEIFPYIDDPMKGVDTLTLETVRFFARALGLNETYSYERDGYVSDEIYNTITTAATYKSDPVETEFGTPDGRYLSVNDKVAKGSKIYMSALNDALTFDLDAEFTFTVSDGTKARVDDGGVVEVVGDGGSFDVYYRCNGEVVYYSTFTIGSDCPISGGGLGTADSPFVVMTKADLETIAGDPSYWRKNFVLAKNIDASGFGGQIGDLSKAFSGTFDGGDHSIKGIKNGLFGKNAGTVKNLTIKDAAVTGKLVSKPSAYAGILAAINDGRIENCAVENSSLNVSYTADVNAGDGNVYTHPGLFAAALCGYNNGTIEKCITKGNTLTTYLSNDIASGGGAPQNDRNFTGGLIGSSTGGSVTDSLSANNTINAKVCSVSYYLRLTMFYTDEYVCNATFNVGGLMGEADGASIVRCVSYGNSLTDTWTYATAQASGNTSNKDLVGSKTENKRPSIGLFSGTNTITNLFCDNSSSNATLIGSASSDKIAAMTENGWAWSGTPSFTVLPASVEVYRLPYKTFYTSGDALNAAGLVLATDTGRYVSDDLKVRNFSTDKDGTIIVTAEWNGLETSFNLTVECDHELEEHTVESIVTCSTKKTTVQYICKKCNKLVSTVVYDAHVGEDQANHVYDNTCDTTCNVCGHVREIEHSWNGGTKSKKETCTTDGEMLYICTVCGAEKREVILATGHAYVATVVPAGCETQGYTVHTCSACSDTYIDNYTDPLGHEWDNGYYTTEPTCTTDGEIVYTCNRCKKTRTEVAKKLGHNYNEYVVAATCTQGGYTIYKCSRCAESYTGDHTPALGHDYVARVVAPTCTEDGHTEHTCSRCKDSYVDARTDALGHNYIERVVAPTCTEKGYTVHTCSRCKDEYTTDPVAPHGHDHSITRTVEPTCTEKGYIAHICIYCDDEERSDHTPALGHDNEFSGFIWEGFSAKAKFICKVCGAEEYEDATITSKTVTLPTCTSTGTTVYTATYGGYSDDKTEITAKTEHTPSDWIVDKEATATEEGHRHKVCSVCKETVAEEDIEKVKEYVEVKVSGCRSAVSAPAVALFAAVTGGALLLLKRKKKKE